MNPQQQGDFDLGNARGYVDIDANGVRAGLDDARRQLNQFKGDLGAFLVSTGEQVRNFGAQWTAIAAPIGAALGAGINAAANFDETLIEIQARTGLTAEAMDEVRETALRLGADTVFSTQDAAAAFLQLTTAGQTAEEALATLPQVLDAAAAGGMDLGRSADLVTNVMSVFAIDAENAQEAIDAMAAASASSPSDMAEMGEALQRAGGQASMFGMDVEQTSAILAIFAQSGLRGSQAGTQLNSMLRNMSRDVPAVHEAWQELGISMYDAQGNTRDLNDVFADLRVALQDLPVQDQNRLIQQLAGSEGLLGFNAIIASDGINTMVGTMNEQSTAAEIAQQRMESFKGQINSLMGSVQALMITALTPFMNNVLRPIVTMLINATNAVRAFAEENEQLTQFIVTLISIFVVLGPVITIAGQAMIIFGGALGVVLSPIGLVVAGIGGIVYMLRDRLPGAVDTARRVIDGLRHLFRHFFNNLSRFGLQDAILSLFGRSDTLRGHGAVLEGMLTRMGFGYETAAEITQDIWIVFATWFNRIANLFNRVSNAVSPAFREISTFVRNNITRISEFAGMVFTLARNFMMLTNPVGQVMLALNAFGVDVFDVFEGVMGRVTTFFSGLNDGVSVAEALQSAFGDSSFFNALLNGFNQIATFITSRVMPALSNLRIWFLQTAMPRITNFINGSALPAIRSFFGILQSVWSRVGPALTQFGGWFINDLIPAVRTLMTEGFIPYWQSIIGLFVGLWSTVAPHLLAFADWFLETGLPAIQTFISDTFLPALTTFLQFMTSIWTTVGPHLNQFADWFLGTGLPAVMGFFAGVVTAFQEGGIAGVGTFIYDKIIAPLLTSITTADWGQIATNILTFLGSAISTIGTWGTWIYNNLLSPILTHAATAITTTDWGAVGTGILNAIGAAILAIFNFATWFTTNVLTPLTTNAQTAIESVDWFAVGENIINAIGAAIVGLFNFVVWINDSILQPIKDNWQSGVDGIDWLAVGVSILTAIGNALVSLFNFIEWVDTSILTPLMDGMESAIAEGLWQPIGTALMDAFANGLPNMLTWTRDNIITPIMNALSNFNPMNTIGAPTYSPTNIGMGLGQRVSRMLGFAHGTNFIGEDMVAMVHRGEMIIPAAHNPANPRASAPFDPGAFSGGRSQVTFAPGSIVVQAPPGMTTQQASQVGETLGDSIMRKLQSNTRNY